ncbi:MAG: DUF2892 domain-containing protein [Chlorobi bacterium]|nr:DUF2892 domain-containing protein [Chlorobiota bacterium]
MKKNVGKIDAAVRVLLAIIIAALGYYYQTWWGLVAIVPIATALMGSCPLYLPFGVSTRKE